MHFTLPRWFVSTLRAVGMGTLHTARIAADFAAVPAMGPAVDAVIGIIELCESVRTNRHECEDLAQRCEDLLYALRSTRKGAAPTRVQEIIERSVKLLEEIKTRMSDWAEAGRAKRFFLQSDIAEGIKRSHDDIDSFLKTFNITSHIEMHAWMDRFEVSRKKDQEEMIQYLSDTKNQVEIVQQTNSRDHGEVMRTLALLQELLSKYQAGDSRHEGLARNLWGLQDASGQLLPNLELKHGEVRRTSERPVYCSAQFDIYRGLYLNQKECAIKAVRGFEMMDVKKMKDRFLREVEIWRKLWELDKGEHFLPFWGARFDEGPYPYMISPWMTHGNVFVYVTTHPDMNRKYLVKRIAEGVHVLHSHDPPIAHGDIRSANILMNEKGDPVITDFGLSKMMETLTEQPFSQTNAGTQSYRWFAPELCRSPGKLSCSSDIFAFAMTVVEIMTGQQPYAHIKHGLEVLNRASRGERPLRPSGPDADVVIARGLDDSMWQLMTACWKENPDERPKIDEVLQRLPAT